MKGRSSFANINVAELRAINSELFLHKKFHLRYSDYRNLSSIFEKIIGIEVSVHEERLNGLMVSIGSLITFFHLFNNPLAAQIFSTFGHFNNARGCYEMSFNEFAIMVWSCCPLIDSKYFYSFAIHFVNLKTLQDHGPGTEEKYQSVFQILKTGKQPLDLQDNTRTKWVCWTWMQQMAGSKEPHRIAQLFVKKHKRCFHHADDWLKKVRKGTEEEGKCWKLINSRWSKAERHELNRWRTVLFTSYTEYYTSSNNSTKYLGRRRRNAPVGDLRFQEQKGRFHNFLPKFMKRFVRIKHERRDEKYKESIQRRCIGVAARRQVYHRRQNTLSESVTTRGQSLLNRIPEEDPRDVDSEQGSKSFKQTCESPPIDSNECSLSEKHWIAEEKVAYQMAMDYSKYGEKEIVPDDKELYGKEDFSLPDVNTEPKGQIFNYHRKGILLSNTLHRPDHRRHSVSPSNNIQTERTQIKHGKTIQVLSSWLMMKRNNADDDSNCTNNTMKNHQKEHPKFQMCKGTKCPDNSLKVVYETN